MFMERSAVLIFDAMAKPPTPLDLEQCSGCAGAGSILNASVDGRWETRCEARTPLAQVLADCPAGGIVIRFEWEADIGRVSAEEK